jgi:tetratricopeptide (TPR) repeat protein
VRPFGRSVADRERFFARETEIEDLLQQVLSHNLMVVYGRSGIGKTSLLNAGLFPRLEEHDLLPIPIRLNHADKQLLPLEVIRARIREHCEEEGLDYEPGEGDTLWEYLKTTQFWRGDTLLTPVLVFDQFEEVLTLQSGSFRSQLGVEIGHVLTPRLPESLRRRLQQGEKLPFGEQPPELRVIIGIREDFVGALHELAPEVPTILLNRFRLAGLSETQATRAIRSPAALVSDKVDFLTRPFSYSEDAHREVLAAARDEDGSFEPFLLQLFCSHIEAKVHGWQQHHEAEACVAPSLYGGESGLRELTSGFYLEAIRQLPGGTPRRRARRLCEEGLIAGAGRRRSVDRDELLREYDLRAEWLDTLENARLLRKEPRLGTHYYELSHDRVARAIYRQRQWRIPAKLRQPLLVGIPLLLGTLVLLLVLQDARTRSEIALRVEAQEQRANALAAKRQAEEATQQALESARAAREAEQLAENRRHQAFEMSREAEFRRTESARLMAFVLRDHRKKLEELGKPQLVEAVCRQAETFYSSLPPSSRTAADEIGHIEALLGIGGAIYKQVAQYWHEPPQKWESSRSKLDEILDHFTRGWQIATNLARQHPGEADHWNYVKVCALSLGHALGARGDLAASSDAYSNALAAAAQAIACEPTSASLQEGRFYLGVEIGDMVFRRAQAIEPPDDSRALLLTNTLAWYEAARRTAEESVANHGASATTLEMMAIALEKVGCVHEALTSYSRALVYFEDSRETARRLVQQAPTNAAALRVLEIAHHTVGRVHRTRGEHEAALANFEAALGVARQVFGLEDSLAHLDDVNDALRNVAVLQWVLDRRDAAYTNSWALLKSLGSAYYLRPDDHEREEQLDRWFSLLVEQLDADQEGDRLLAVHAEWEIVLRYRMQKSLALETAASVVVPQLTRDFKRLNEPVRRALNTQYRKIGELHQKRRDFSRAFEAYRQSIRLCQEMAGQVEDGEVDWEHELLSAHAAAVEVLREMDLSAEALRTYEDMRHIAQGLVARQTTNLLWKRHLAFIESRIGSLYTEQERFDKALPVLTNAVKLAAEVLQVDPTPDTYHGEWLDRVSALAGWWESQTNADGQVRVWTDAAASMESLQGRVQSPEAQLLTVETLSTVYQRLETLCLRQRRIPEARQVIRKLLGCYEQLAAAHPKDAERFGNLAFQCLLAGEFEQARQAAEQGLQLAPDKAWIAGNLAHALMFLKRTNEAVALHRRYLNVRDIGNGLSWKQAALDDFETFRTLGLNEPPGIENALSTIEKLLEPAR